MHSISLNNFFPPIKFYHSNSKITFYMKNLFKEKSIIY